MAGQRERMDVDLQLVVQHLPGSGQHSQQLFCMPLPGQCDVDVIAPTRAGKRKSSTYACMVDQTCMVACNLSLCCLLGLRSWVQDIRGGGKQGRAQQACKLAAGLRI